MSGRISLWITTLGAPDRQHPGREGARLAVSGASRSELFPDVPTFKESGGGFVDETSRYGIFAPKGTPKEVVARINGDVNRILEQPDLKARTATMGFRLFGGEPEKLRAMLQAEIDKGADIAKLAEMTKYDPMRTWR
jgi:tripartite-type tricarboxylate transporter receptor subunit TctC